MNFFKKFERRKPTSEKKVEELSDAELLEKLQHARLNYDSIARHWNYARNPSPHILKEFPGIENSGFRDSIIKETDNELAAARQEVNKIEEEARKRNLPL